MSTGRLLRVYFCLTRSIDRKFGDVPESIAIMELVMGVLAVVSALMCFNAHDAAAHRVLAVSSGLIGGYGGVALGLLVGRLNSPKPGHAGPDDIHVRDPSPSRPERARSERVRQVARSINGGVGRAAQSPMRTLSEPPVMTPVICVGAAESTTGGLPSRGDQRTAVTPLGPVVTDGAPRSTAWSFLAAR